MPDVAQLYSDIISPASLLVRGGFRLFFCFSLLPMRRARTHSLSTWRASAVLGVDRRLAARKSAAGRGGAPRARDAGSPPSAALIIVAGESVR